MYKCDARHGLPITFAVRLILSDEELWEFAPRSIFYHIRISTALHTAIYSNSSVPLELRGWRRLYLRITIFDADEHQGVAIPGSSVTKEDLSLETTEWNEECVFLKVSLESGKSEAFLLITAPAVSVKSTVEGTVGGGEGRRRGGG